MVKAAFPMTQLSPRRSAASGRVAAILVGLALTLVVVSSAFAASVCYKFPFSNPNVADGFGSLKGRTSPHRGLDFPQPADTPVPAVADGVVKVVTTSGCLGNVLVIGHADGMYSGYAHLIRPPSVKVGDVVKLGQIVANVGKTGTCATGNHLHLSMSPLEGGWGAGTVIDPYKYINEHKTCTAEPVAATDAGTADASVGIALAGDPETSSAHEDADDIEPGCAVSPVSSCRSTGGGGLASTILIAFVIAFGRRRVKHA